MKNTEAIDAGQLASLSSLIAMVIYIANAPPMSHAPRCMHAWTYMHVYPSIMPGIIGSGKNQE